MRCDCDRSDRERSGATCRNETIRFPDSVNATILNYRNSTSNPMITRLAIAVSAALFFTPAVPLLAAEHPGQQRQPQFQQLPQTTTRPLQSYTQTKEVSKADISAGIKKYIESDTKKSSDRKFHVSIRAKISRS